MLSNKLRKQIQQLKLKKFRKQYNLFVAEGEKVVLHLLSAEFIPEVLLATKEFASIEPFRITTQEMRSITHFSSPSPIMGVFQIPNHTIDSVPTFQLVLDQIKDPGNLGTIIRTSDWYGLSQIVCSLDCVDCFNPKVVQATMGSIARVKLHYVALESYLKKIDKPIYFADMNGGSINESKCTPEGVLVLGNESHGISESLYHIKHESLTIPKQNLKNNGAESLNVAVAAAILLHEFFRPPFIQK